MLSEFNHSLIKPLRIRCSKDPQALLVEMQNVQPLHEGTVIILIKITGAFTLSPSKHISRNLNKTPAHTRNNT